MGNMAGLSERRGPQDKELNWLSQPLLEYEQGVLPLKLCEMQKWN